MNWHVTDAPVNPDPVTVSAVPPATDPARGATASTRGSAVNSNWAEVAEKSAPFRDTRTSTAPGSAEAGVKHDTVVLSTNVAGTAAHDPNWHTKCGENANPDPLTATSVPPVAGPTAGATFTTSTSSPYTNRPSAVTNSTPFSVNVNAAGVAAEPAALGGATNVNTVLDSHRVEEAGWPFTATARCAESTNPDPLTVTTVPPDDGPNRGDTSAMTGVAMDVNVTESTEKSTPFTDTATVDVVPAGMAGATQVIDVSDAYTPGTKTTATSPLSLSLSLSSPLSSPSPSPSPSAAENWHTSCGMF